MIGFGWHLLRWLLVRPLKLPLIRRLDLRDHPRADDRLGA